LIFIFGFHYVSAGTESDVPSTTVSQKFTGGRLIDHTSYTADPAAWHVHERVAW